MKLVLDEMLAPAIARQLRAKGHDVIAVAEQPALMGLSDADQFERAQLDGRVIVTYNRDDYLELDRRYRADGREHAGIVILNPHRFPQVGKRYGRIVSSLDALIRAGAPYPGFVHWAQ